MATSELARFSFFMLSLRENVGVPGNLGRITFYRNVNETENGHRILGKFFVYKFPKFSNENIIFHSGSALESVYFPTPL